MVQYILKTKGGEVINKVYANSINEANYLFAQVKRLPIPELLRLFNVDVG